MELPLSELELELNCKNGIDPSSDAYGYVAMAMAMAMPMPAMPRHSLWLCLWHAMAYGYAYGVMVRSSVLVFTSCLTS